MPIRIEFFGVPRHRVGVEAIEVEAATLGDALRAAQRSLPQMKAICLPDGGVCHGCLVNLNGREFISDPTTTLKSGDAVLILSSDAGG